MTKLKRKLVLDLDQTLLCTVDYDTVDRELRRTGTSLNLQYIDSMFNHITYIRPYLFNFLDYVFANFDVSIFTASLHDYAHNIVSKLFTNYHLDKVLTQQDFLDCLIFTRKFKYIDYISKRIPGYTRENTTIIDDNSQVIESNIGNVIPIKPFDILDSAGRIILGCDRDRELLVMIDMLSVE